MNVSTKIDPSGFAIRWSDELAARYRREGHWRDTILVDDARVAVAEDPDRLLVIDQTTRLTRGEAWKQALRLVAFFDARGLCAGDVVSFQLPNWAEAIVVSLAARMAGLVANPIPPIYRASELAYILADCGSKMIFVPAVFRRHDHSQMLESLRDTLPALRDVIVVRGTGATTWEDALAFAPKDDGDLPKVDPAAVMMLMYTSGTTGKPKGVMHVHQAFDHRARAMIDAWNVGPDDMVFVPSPITHIAGAFWGLDIPWISGCTSVLMDVWGAEEGIRCIEEYGCTIAGGATPFLAQLVETGKDRPEALATLKLFFCGGTTVSPDLIRAANALFPNCSFFRAYGSTEMTTLTLGIRDKALAELGAETDGEVVYPVEVRILDAETDVPVPDGDEGEIVSRGPGLFVGYLHAQDNADCFLDDGFFRMGDLGRRVHEDYLVITGRKKDIIIRSGENISPKEVEDLLFNHPAIAEVAIVAMPSPLTGEKGCAFVIPRAGQNVDLPGIQRFLDGAGLAKQKYPEHLVVVDDLPRVPSGKVKKDVLRVRAREIAEADA